MTPNREKQHWMYRNMVTSRKFEETIAKIYFEGKLPVFSMADGPIPGEMHLSDGQEPVAVGVCAHLEASDIVTATHRPHHQAIATTAVGLCERFTMRYVAIPGSAVRGAAAHDHAGAGAGAGAGAAGAPGAAGGGVAAASASAGAGATVKARCVR